MVGSGQSMKTWLFKTFWALIRLSAGLIFGLHLYALSLTILPVPITLNMIKTQKQGQSLNYQWVPLEKISPRLVQAVIAAEDSRFCSHHGLSWPDIREAVETYRTAGRLRGASTLSQQTAKNVFFWNGGGLLRKAGEAWMAMIIDFVWGKPRLLEVYLNVAEWGDGIYGAEAAAQIRFGRSADTLSDQQAALLAAVLPSPNRYRLDPPGPYVRRQAGLYVARMQTVRDQGLDFCVYPRG